ncbi:Beta-glucuronidase [Fulvia fulva]|uniref:Beta-glucuronidase n=1 Tax=Passalora fulva TaxID=5499 RepID=A0A9Q8P9C0_PASFU|nr:Beta-glucuronidase [Fulvia fulva]KAK4623620.1 Beta-glucuronidase [Fulvia fulva]KAK4625841.1 Beta-glucuronidase [Fulvia fulva]UJO18135.1 Beta-glucuronidase [Fulvia fulva]WPV14990.1 Beta-glucuronidase [Fulvia fulva]WPV29654.1 Beta-glucuronidase [Fulvia fulva]
MAPALSTLALAATLHAAYTFAGSSGSHAIHLDVPSTCEGASIKHSPSYTSFSFEPAFWVEFFGNLTEPNTFTFGAINTLIEHGLRPVIRPGGITMDSLIFEPTAGDPVRTTSPAGGVYRTTVGPAYYESWSNFPNGTDFVSTLNFGNDSLDIARDMAVASVEYQPDLIKYFELGNEPTNYPPARWANSTENYVRQWQNWTAEIDAAVNGRSKGEWWASSATTDETPLHVRPADLIPAGINSGGEVAEYSIHSYAFATCDPERAALATTANILNHTGLVEYADTEIVPSAQAALDSGKPWIIGEFNSIACSGQPNVSDSFAQALWEVDTELIYAVRNASATYLHQGATLVFQSNQQTNSAGDDGTPGFSTYSMLYPVTSSKRGEQRTLPGFAGILFLAEAFAVQDTQIRALPTPEGLSEDHFSAYAFYLGDRLTKLALINIRPYHANSTSDYAASFKLPSQSKHGRFSRGQKAYAKRMTAPHVDEKDSSKVTWAGQSFKNGTSVEEVAIEQIGKDDIVTVRGSEALLIFFDQDECYGLESPTKGKSWGRRWRHWWSRSSSV